MTKVSVKDTDKFDTLVEFVDAIIKEGTDSESIDKPISQFIAEKAKAIAKAMREKPTEDDEDEEDEDDTAFLKTRDKAKAPLKKMKTVDESVASASKEEDEENESDEDSSKFLKNRDKKKAPLKKMKKMEEAVVTEEDEAVVRLKGDDVFVEGKLVGSIKNDLNNADAGITFTSTDGKIGEEFDNMKQLYSFVMSKYAADAGMDLE